MVTKTLFRNFMFWLELVIVILAIILFAMTYTGRFNFIYATILSVPIHHWFSWIGVSFIAIYLPAFYYLKRHYQKGYQTFANIHVLGNLFSFLLISIHFGHHLREFTEIIPHPGTGVPLYTAVAFLVITGIMMRFQIQRTQMRFFRSLHIGMAMAFYLIIVFHILHGLGVF